MPRETLSASCARKLVLASQRLPYRAARGSAVAASMDAVRHLGYVQIDTISVVERAHHHTLWNRTRLYQKSHIDELLATRQVFEYWAHAAAYLPLDDYRFSLPRMNAHRSGKQHWFAPDRKIVKSVLARIRAEGALRARDFESPKREGGMWNWKPAKQALEQLFMEGRLMTARRDGFNKVYDLTERVLPAGTDTRTPSDDEYGRHLTTAFLRANGLGRATEIAHRRSDDRKIIEASVADMAASGEIIEVEVGGRVYYALPSSLELLGRRLPHKMQTGVQILSPFDNLLIQRERMRHLFDFDYQIECYTPAAKRKYGYFSLPILAGDKLVARMDCKAMRKTRVLQVREFFSEAQVGDKTANRYAWAAGLADELREFAAFNHCAKIEIGRLADKTMQKFLRAHV